MAPKLSNCWKCLKGIEVSLAIALMILRDLVLPYACIISLMKVINPPDNLNAV